MEKIKSEQGKLWLSEGDSKVNDYGDSVNQNQDKINMEKCICSTNITDLRYVRHQTNHNCLLIGSCCIKKFNIPDDSRIRNFLNVCCISAFKSSSGGVERERTMGYLWTYVHRYPNCSRQSRSRLSACGGFNWIIFSA